MFFPEIIVVYAENHTKPTKHKLQMYQLLKQVVHVVTTRLQEKHNFGGEFDESLKYISFSNSFNNSPRKCC
jgi:hypothetical protein